MRKKIVAGNWKMNLNMVQGVSLVGAILKNLPDLNELKQVVLAPSFLNIGVTYQQIMNTPFLSIGAQNCHQEEFGAFTGEVSASMIKGAGASHVILGHSERREYFNETSSLLKKKVDAALAQELTVIFCCGEPLSIRDAATENDYVAQQIQEGLFHLEAAQMKHIVIAYEPIWAIGTGRTATAPQAQDMHHNIRNVIATKYGSELAGNTTILYGGSCKPSNAEELFACPDVDGGLIGGAALNAEDFVGIITAMMNSK
jgi:triosephosphate isomerase (TIM)